MATPSRIGRFGNVTFPSEGTSPDKENDVAITEKSRHDLRKYLEETMGEERAMTLMDHLPPVGWADVATKQDLDHLREIMDLRFEAIDGRFGLMVTRAELHNELRKHTMAMAGMMITLFGLFPLLYRFV